MQKKYFTIVPMFAFVVSFALFTSCGKKEQTNTGGEKKEDVKTSTEQPKQDKQPEQNKPSNDLGISEGLPKDYPSDIPQPKNAKNMGYLTTSEGTVVTFESDEKPKDVYDAFTAQIEKNGYKKDEGGAMMSDDGGLALWKKDTKECSVMLAWDKDKKKSSIVVTYK